MCVCEREADRKKYLHRVNRRPREGELWEPSSRSTRENKSERERELTEGAKGLRVRKYGSKKLHQ